MFAKPSKLLVISFKATLILNFIMLAAMVTHQAKADEDFDDLLAKPIPKEHREWTAGLHENVPCITSRDTKFSLYMPPAVAAKFKADANARFPSLYVHNPSGRIMKDMKRYQAWADQRGVIIVGIPRVRNGLAAHIKRQMQGHILKSLDEMKVPVHPYLRFTIGMSGGSADGERMVRWHGGQNRFAGTVQMGVFKLPRPSNAAIAIASLQGARDSWIKPPKLYEDLATAQDRGTPMKLYINPDIGHKAAPIDMQTDMLDWMLGLMKLTHPKHDEKAKAFYLEQAKQEMKQILKMEDQAARMKQIERVASYKPLNETEELNALIKQWAIDANAMLAKTKDKLVLRQQLETLLEKTPVTFMGDDQKKKWIELKDRLAKDEAVAHDIKVRELYEKARDMDIRAGLVKEEMYKAALAYQQLIEFDNQHPLSKSVAEKTQRWLEKFKP